MGRIPFESIATLSPLDRAALMESPLRPRDVTFSEALGASFRGGNTLGFAYGAGERLGERIEFGDLVEPGYSPYLDEDLNGYMDFLDEFEASKHPIHTAAIKRRIDGYHARDAVMAGAGGKGVAASLIAGLLDPVNVLVPGSYGVAATRLGQAGRFAAAGAVAGGAYEVGAQADDPRRTAKDALSQVSGTVFLSAILGGVLPRVGAKGKGPVVRESYYSYRPPGATEAVPVAPGGAPGPAGEAATREGFFSRSPDDIETTGTVLQAEILDGLDVEATIAAALPRQKVFHGTARDFSSFSNEKIGTGEGAQAFGWGHYAASQRGIGEFYRAAMVRNLSGEGRLRIAIPDEIEQALKDSGLGRHYPYSRDALLYVASRGGDRFWQEIEWKVLGRSPDTMPPIRDVPAERAAMEKIQAFVDEKIGKVHEAEIPNDAEFLDWDAPMSQQTDKIQTTMKGLLGKGYNPDATGKESYRALARMRGGPQGASGAMFEAGIPGNKYFDAPSRARGEGTRNYVVFDDSAITMVGQEPPAPAPTPARAAPVEDPEVVLDRSAGAAALALQAASPNRLGKLKLEPLVKAVRTILQTPALHGHTSKNPAIQLWTELVSPSPMVREGAETLATGHTGPSADAHMRMFRQQFSDAETEITNVFHKYRKAGMEGVDVSFRRRHGGTGREIQKIDDFMEMVGRATENGGKIDPRDAARITEAGAIAAVERGAALMIKTRDWMTKLAVELGLIDESDLLDDYFTRVFDQQKIITSPLEGPDSFIEDTARGFAEHPTFVEEEMADGTKAMVPRPRPTMEEARSAALGTHRKIRGDESTLEATLYGTSGKFGRQREIELPTHPYFTRWVVSDVRKILQHWSRLWSGRLALAKRIGSNDMGDSIWESAVGHYEAEVRALDAAAAEKRALIDPSDEKALAKHDAKTEKARTVLKKEHDRDHKIFDAQRNHLLGRSGLTNDRTLLAFRIGNVIKNMAYMASGGFIGFRSALMDPAAAMTVTGKESWARAAMASQKLAGLESPELATRSFVAHQLLTNERRVEVEGLARNQGLGTRVERLAEKGAQWMAKGSGLTHETAYIGGRLSLAASDMVLRNSARLVAADVVDGLLSPKVAGITLEEAEQTLKSLGRPTKAEMVNLELSGISRDLAYRIAREHRAQEVRWLLPDGTEDPKGLWVSGSENWADQDAAMAYQASNVQDVGRGLAFPRTGELPLLADHSILGHAFMYRRFMISMSQSIVLSGLQRGDKAFAEGAMAMLFMGGVTYALMSAIRGEKPSDDPKVWAMEALSNSGLLGIIEPFANFGRSYLPWGRTSRFSDQDRNAIAGGPVYSYLVNLWNAPFKPSHGLTAGELHAIRKLLPYQNLLGLRNILDAAESGIVDEFRLPKRQRQKANAR